MTDHHGECTEPGVEPTDPSGRFRPNGPSTHWCSVEDRLKSSSTNGQPVDTAVDARLPSRVTQDDTVRLGGGMVVTGASTTERIGRSETSVTGSRFPPLSTRRPTRRWAASSAAFVKIGLVGWLQATGPLDHVAANINECFGHVVSINCEY